MTPIAPFGLFFFSGDFTDRKQRSKKNRGSLKAAPAAFLTLSGESVGGYG